MNEAKNEREKSRDRFTALRRGAIERKIWGGTWLTKVGEGGKSSSWR